MLYRKIIKEDKKWHRKTSNKQWSYKRGGANDVKKSQLKYTNLSK